MNFLLLLIINPDIILSAEAETFTIDLHPRIETVNRSRSESGRIALNEKISDLTNMVEPELIGKHHRQEYIKSQWLS